MVPQNVRIKFSKTGRLRYISHLDLCRTMTPAMIRAGIPIWYTEGFNPHPKMVFTQPLPLFATSECEYLDIKITEPMSFAQIKERLNGALANGLNVSEVYEPDTKFTDIAYACYEISGFDITDEMLKSALTGAIEIEKRTKSGQTKSVDIAPQIKNAQIKDGRIFCVLNASGESYLNPDMFCRGVQTKLGISADFEIKRVGWLCSDGKEFK